MSTSINNINMSIEQLVFDAQVAAIDGLYERLSVDMEMGDAEFIFTKYKSDLTAALKLAPTVDGKAKKVSKKEAAALAAASRAADKEKEKEKVKVKKEKKPPTSYNVFIGLRLKELKIQFPAIKHDKIMKMIPSKTWDSARYKEFEAAHIDEVRAANVTSDNLTDTRVNELVMLEYMKTVTWVLPDINEVLGTTTTTSAAAGAEAEAGAEVKFEAQAEADAETPAPLE